MIDIQHAMFCYYFISFYPSWDPYITDHSDGRCASTTSLTPGLTGWSLLRSKTVHFKTDKIIESWVVVFVFHFQSSSISVLTRVRLSSYHADIPNCLPDVCVITYSSILKPLILKKLLLVVSIKDALHDNSSSSSVKYVKGAQCFN